MIYPTVVDDALDLMVADGTITGVVPATAIRKWSDADFMAPSIFWQLIVETPDFEVYKQSQVQFDVFTRSQSGLHTVVDEIERLFHRGRQWTLGTTQVRSQVLAIRDEFYRDGVHRGSLDVWFKAVRRPYS